MASRCIHHTEVSGRSHNPEIIWTPAAQRISHGGHLSQPRAPRRSLRTSCASTAFYSSDICPDSKAQIHEARTPSTVLLAPLSQQQVSLVSSPCLRQSSGSVISTSSSYTLVSECQSEYSRTRKHALLATHSPDFSNHSKQAWFRTKLMLWHARQAVAAAADTGASHMPSIMDVVLDLKGHYDSDTLVDLLQRRRRWVGACCTDTDVVYTFEDEHSLITYWADQDVLWNGMRTVDVATSTRFPDSDERSTGSWTSTLNGELSGKQ